MNAPNDMSLGFRGSCVPAAQGGLGNDVLQWSRMGGIGKRSADHALHGAPVSFAVFGFPHATVQRPSV
jgi:hypothetical protein